MTSYRWLAYRWLVLCVCVTIAANACGSDSDSVCDEVIEESIDARSSIHVLDPADGPDEAAPTSGPHVGVGEPGGLYEEAIPSAIQLRILERGQVIVQYRDDIDRDELVSWHGDEVTIAPNPNIDGPIVATAQGTRMNCRSVDTASLEEFVDEYARRPAD